jgi:hypothetical protein
MKQPPTSPAKLAGRNRAPIARWFALLSTGLMALAAGGAKAEPLLPDLIAWANPTPSQCYMHCFSIDNELIDNQVLFRFHGALPNIGDGPLELREVTHIDGEERAQDVFQRIYDSEGGMTEAHIGTFEDAFSIPPRHLFLPGIAQYNLRMVTAGNGVGPVVASNDKTSMAVVDSAAYNKLLPGAPDTPVYTSVQSAILGISIGWADVYSTSLPGQWIEVTGLPDGQYWLEVIANPYGPARIQESDYTNNTTRILVDLVVPEPQIIAGDYNQDDEVDASDYVVWRTTLGQTGLERGTAADGDGDGQITAADYDVWRANFGNTRTSGTAAGTSVPEPSTVALVLCVALGWRPRRHVL